MKPNEERALVSNQVKLGLLKGDRLLILDNHKNHTFYHWNSSTNELIAQKTNLLFLNEAVSYYQTAFDLFKNDGLKLNIQHIVVTPIIIPKLVYNKKGKT